MKKEFREKFSDKAILKNIWIHRFKFIGLGIGISSAKMIESDVLDVVPTSLIAVTLLFVLAFIDFKLSKNKKSG